VGFAVRTEYNLASAVTGFVPGERVAPCGMSMAHENDQVGFGSELDPKRLISACNETRGRSRPRRVKKPYPGYFRRRLGVGRERHGKHTQTKSAQECASVNQYAIGTAHDLGLNWQNARAGPGPGQERTAR